MAVERRDFTRGAIALIALGVPLSVSAASADVSAAIEAILAGREAVEGGIELEVPRVAENGAQVPVTIRVESPMTEADHVVAIHLLATANPTPGIGTFHMTPLLARAEVFTRLRLAEEQEFRVLAELSDGRVLAAATRVTVTLGGCAT